MPKPCQHITPVCNCNVCETFMLREDYRLLWSGAPAEEVWAASLEISKKNGHPPVFSRPDAALVKGFADTVAKDRCVHLGITVSNPNSGCRTTYECDNGHGHVRACVECRICKDFTSDVV